MKMHEITRAAFRITCSLPTLILWMVQWYTWLGITEVSRVLQSQEHYANNSQVYSSVRAGRLGFDSRYGQGSSIFVIASKSALGPTQPPTQWVPGAFFPQIKQSSL